MGFYRSILSVLGKIKRGIAQNDGIVFLDEYRTKLDSFDTYTANHSYRVGKISQLFGQSMGLDDAMVHQLLIAGTLHDVGKVYVPPTLLNNPHPLSEEQLNIIRSHVLQGIQLLETAGIQDHIVEVVGTHHERYDGSGYPNGLKQEEIPLAARIIKLADYYDALRSKRSYKDPMSNEQVNPLIIEGLGKSFDPHLGELFLDNVVDNLEFCYDSTAD